MKLTLNPLQRSLKPDINNLLWGVGQGKTFGALHLAKLKYNATFITHCVIIAHNNIMVKQWKEQVQIALENNIAPNIQYYYTTATSLHKSVKKYPELLAKAKTGLYIIDEIHLSYQHFDSERFKNLKKVTKAVSPFNFIALTGTLIKKDESDIFSILYAINRFVWDSNKRPLHNIFLFNQYFFNLSPPNALYKKKLSFKEERRGALTSQMAAYSSVSHLDKRVLYEVNRREFQIRMNRGECTLGFTKKELEYIDTLPAPDNVRIKRLACLGIIHIPTYEYRDIINQEGKKETKRIRTHLEEREGNMLKMKWLFDTIASIPKEEGYIIFTPFVAIRRMIANKLAERGFDCMLYDKHDNKVLSKYLKKEGGGIVSSCKLLGTGIDGLQHKVNHILFYGLDYVAVDVEQAEGRVLRKGQTKKVTIYTIKVLNSIEHKIEKILEDKIYGNKITQEGIDAYAREILYYNVS